MTLWNSLRSDHKAMLASYGRSALAAVVAVTATGNYSADDLFKAAVAALIPLAIRYANPNDSAFGKVKIVVKPTKASKSKPTKKSA